jgi:hypothetical protein
MIMNRWLTSVVAVTFALAGLVGCGNSEQEQIASWASKSIEWKDQADGSRLVTFATPYFYGDKVEFNSINGAGTGFIDGIVLDADGSIHYTIQDEAAKLEDGQFVIHGGIYPEEIKLIQRGIKSSGLGQSSE